MSLNHIYEAIVLDFRFFITFTLGYMKMNNKKPAFIFEGGFRMSMFFVNRFSNHPLGDDRPRGDHLCFHDDRLYFLDHHDFCHHQHFLGF